MREGVISMKKIYLKKYDGRYEADIDITVSEWKSMLQNTDIFNKESLDMVINWYKEVEHQATSKAIMEKYHPELKSSPYNGIVNGLATRIIKHLNRFEVIGTQGQKSKFVIPFEGWYEDYNPSKRFVWKLRDELAQALEELNLVEELEPVKIYVPVKDRELDDHDIIVKNLSSYLYRFRLLLLVI
jgi:5-methylcytosine-specific restriction protein A